MTKMSKRKQENVSDIVAEMRDTCHNPTLGIKTDREKELEKFLKDIMIEYADRIEAAEGRENARLRAALKPVLECKVMSAMTAEIAPGKSAYCAGIIEEAQRIYNGGGESEVK